MDAGGVLRTWIRDDNTDRAYQSVTNIQNSAWKTFAGTIIYVSEAHFSLFWWILVDSFTVLCLYIVSAWQNEFNRILRYLEFAATDSSIKQKLLACWSFRFFRN